MSTQDDFFAEASFNSIGRPLRRKEDERLLTGAGRFTDDFGLTAQAYAVVVRSPYPHAKIVNINTEPALATSGVLGVFTGADAIADGLKPIPHTPAAQSRYDLNLTAPGGGAPFIGAHHVLAVDKVRYVGEAVVVVIAETYLTALDAAELVEIEYDELSFVTRSDESLEPTAPLVWDEHRSNVLIDSSFGDAEATERAFEAADHVVRAQFTIGRVTAVPLEPRAALGEYDKEGARYTLYAGNGGVVKQRSDLAYVLNVPPDRVRVLSLDVGGNFGSRNRPYVEFVLVLWTSRKVGRPVKFTATRSESFLTDYQGRDLLTNVELAMRADGRILAMRADNISNVGAVCVSLSSVYKGASLITGAYDIPCATSRARAVFTHSAPVSAYRSSGRPEVTFALERLIDIAALDLGLDPIDLRRKNLIAREAMPYSNPVGSTYDSGDYKLNMDLALDLAEFKEANHRKMEARQRGKLRGIGVSNYVEASSGAPKERAEISVQPAGRVRIVVGTQPSGQGHETSFSQVAADLLSVPVEVIDILYGDTDVVNGGGGTHSGRSMRHAGTAIAHASSALISRAKGLVARVLEAPEPSVQYKDGKFSSTLSNRTFDLFELARTLNDPDADGLSVVLDNEMHEPVFPNGCAVCEVEIDPDTGLLSIISYVAVDDVGRCINPMIVKGQTHGGIAQGLGQALSELCYLDVDSGQPLYGSFMDYGIPRAASLPNFKDEIVEILSPTNPLGIKAGGEGGTTPALAAVINAIVDALADKGVRDIAMPATPHAIWRAVHGSADS